MLFRIVNKASQQQITMLMSLAEVAEQFPDGKQVIETDSEGELLATPSTVDIEIVPADDEARKVYGEAYADTGVIIPFTARAADAFMQVNAGLNLAVQQGVDPSTLMSVLSFDNGSKLPVAVEAATINGVECHKFADVEIWFYNKRNSFYQNT